MAALLARLCRAAYLLGQSECSLQTSVHFIFPDNKLPKTLVFQYSFGSSKIQGRHMFNFCIIHMTLITGDVSIVQQTG